MAPSSTSSATMNGGGAGCMAAEGGERGWTRRATGTDEGTGQRDCSDTRRANGAAGRTRLQAGTLTSAEGCAQRAAASGSVGVGRDGRAEGDGGVSGGENGQRDANGRKFESHIHAENSTTTQ